MTSTDDRILDGTFSDCCKSCFPIKYSILEREASAASGMSSSSIESGEKEFDSSAADKIATAVAISPLAQKEPERLLFHSRITSP
jgi:hypothetical protein